MIDELFKRAIDGGLAWIGHGRKLRASFFKEQAEPIHEVFKQFKAEHMATFAEVRARLADPAVPLDDIYELVENRERFERESWMKFERFDELARESRARPSDLYFAYLAELRRCLIETQGNPTSIVYYHSLEEELEEAIGRAKSSSGTKACERAEAIRSVDDITLKFQEYCTSVEMAFLRLRGDSMV